MAKDNPAAFMSYVRLDDKNERLSAFADLLGEEVRVQTGEKFLIFQDRRDIKWGQNWKRRIEESLNRVTFLIAFITPSFFKSPNCREELQHFLKREETLGRNDLILPVYYVECEQFRNEEVLETDELAQAILLRQYIDWRDLRFKPIDSLEVGERMAHLAAQIREALQRVKEAEGTYTSDSSIQDFAEHINNIEPGETYSSIVRYSAQLLTSERASLLLSDESSDELLIKAAVGPRVSELVTTRVSLEEGVSGTVIRTGQPLIVSDIDLSNYKPAPAERGYKTKSFICFPIIIRGKSFGVINFTDKTGQGPYSKVDLHLLERIAPQMALAMDRDEWYAKATQTFPDNQEWHSRAAQLQILSLTDPLTGLLNRRYLEERLSEELRRSNRYDYAMSFMMIDMDDFKNYNNLNGHPAGDEALRLVAECLKSSVRSADVAVRYAGEEFSILLPQTTISEAREIAERIRRGVERTTFPHGNTQPLKAVTVSIGISSLNRQVNTPAQIIYSADRALYLAKSRGKNCVQEFEEAL